MVVDRGMVVGVVDPGVRVGVEAPLPRSFLGVISTGIETGMDTGHILIVEKLMVGIDRGGGLTALLRGRVAIGTVVGGGVVVVVVVVVIGGGVVVVGVIAMPTISSDSALSLAIIALLS